MLLLKKRSGLTALILSSSGILTGLSGMDREWTQFLVGHKWPVLADFMSRTVLEGDRPGANDAVVIYVIVALAAYFLGGLRPRFKRLAALRPQTGFMLTSILICGVYLVHGLKWIVARARPGVVQDLGLPFSQWYEFGPHFISEGIYSGSFPSGHTAQAFLLMAIAYCLAADPLLRRSYRVLGWIVGVGVTAFTLTMAVARCMTLSHWLTDVLGSLLLGWILMHWLYYYILKVPQQRRYLAMHGCLPPLPRFWELALSAYFFIITIAAVLIIMGGRALAMPQAAWLIVLIPIGVVLIVLAFMRSAHILKILNTHLHSVEPGADRIPYGEHIPAGGSKWF